jgi:uncharacterized protein YegL
MGFAKYQEDILSRLISDKYMNKKITIELPSIQPPIKSVASKASNNSTIKEKDIKMSGLKNFVIPTPRPLPIIILADTSGSMSADGKIEALNIAMTDMIATFAKESRLRADIQIGMITFGNSAQVHLPLASASSINSTNKLLASGSTPMGAAFDLARQLLEDKELIPSRAYRPILILLSDGLPTDVWEAPFKALCDSERAQKATRLAMAIGPDADEAMLREFANDPEAPIFKAHNARDIHRFFRAVTMSVTVRTASQNPDTPVRIDVPPPDDGVLDLDF